MPRWCCVSLYACSKPIPRRLADFAARIFPQLMQHCAVYNTVF